jgi:3-methyladenine DNA glycosylase/8-oxoguanine DNA glycosylase
MAGVLSEAQPRNRLAPAGPPSTLPYDGHAAITHLSAADGTLAALIQQVGPFTLTLAEEQAPFEALAESIIYQQLSGKAAATIAGRVRLLFAPQAFPEPADILAATDEALRGCGVSGNKVLALRDLARHTLSGTVPTLAAMQGLNDDELIARLTQVRGIGRWTVEMLLMFRLGRPDVLPTADLGVRKGFARTYGLPEMPTPKDLLAHGERWRPFRSVASWYLWRATELPLT